MSKIFALSLLSGIVFSACALKSPDAFNDPQLKPLDATGESLVSEIHADLISDYYSYLLGQTVTIRDSLNLGLDAQANPDSDKRLQAIAQLNQKCAISGDHPGLGFVKKLLIPYFNFDVEPALAQPFPIPGDVAATGAACNLPWTFHLAFTKDTANEVSGTTSFSFKVGAQAVGLFKISQLDITSQFSSKMTDNLSDQTTKHESQSNITGTFTHTTRGLFNFTIQSTEVCTFTHRMAADGTKSFARVPTQPCEQHINYMMGNGTMKFMVTYGNSSDRSGAMVQTRTYNNVAISKASFEEFFVRQAKTEWWRSY